MALGEVSKFLQWAREDLKPLSTEYGIPLVLHVLHSVYKRKKKISLSKGLRKGGRYPGDSKNLRVERDLKSNDIQSFTWYRVLVCRVQPV